MVDRTVMQSGRYKAYPEYKDSGVEWIGEIPSSWDVVRVKNQFKVYNGATPKSGVEEYWGGDVVWVTPSDLSQLNNNTISESSRTITKQGLNSCGTSLVPVDSLILSCRAPIGSLAITKTELCTNQGCKALVPISDTPVELYYYYFSSINDELNVLGSGSTFLELSTDELVNIALPLPSYSESKLICDFLDHETAKIDSLIEKQQRLIELLTEKRQAVISHAVTKGLNPDAPMKDSGVEWLGEVPAHWDVSSLRWFIDIASGKGLSSEELNKEKSESHPIPAVGGNGVMGFTNKVNTKDKALAIGRVGALCGNVHLIDYNAWITDNALKISRWRGFSQEYLAKLLEAANLNELASKTAQPLITGEQVKSLIIVIPPLSEQKEIASFIDKMHVQFNLLTQKAQQAIQLMQERRTALISAAVTGKIDVRDWVKPE